MTRSRCLVEWIPMDECATIDEIIQNGTGKRRPRRYLTCRKCGRRTRNINQHPKDANGWTVTPRKNTTCPECIELQEQEQAIVPETTRTNYQKEIFRVKHQGGADGQQYKG